MRRQNLQVAQDLKLDVLLHAVANEKFWLKDVKLQTPVSVMQNSASNLAS
jgi:hypothetical protein